MSWELLLSYWALFLGVLLWLFVSYRAAKLYQSWSRGKWFQSVVAFGVTVMRQRYGLLMCIAPAVLGVVALLNPNMLQALLLAREENAFWDIFKITMISFFTVGVGLAQCRLVELNGDERFPKVEALLSTDAQQSVQSVGAAATATMDATPSSERRSEGSARPGAARKKVAPGWSRRRFVWWYFLGLLFPLIVLGMTCHEGSKQTITLWTGLIVGVVSASLVALFVACLADWVLGHINQTAHAGILPFESCADWLGDRLWGTSASVSRSPDKGIAGWLFGNKDHGFSWLLQGPGYTDVKTGILLPGQPQALILVAFSTVVYFVGYFGGLSDATWNNITWPTGFCAVLLLFLIGYAMSSLAFWLDRYGLPPVIFAMLYTSGVFYFAASDHYFEIEVPPAAWLRDQQAKKDPASVPPVSTEERYAYVAAATTPDHATEDHKAYEQLYWADILKDWPFPKGPDGKKTLVVVTASGGGIQAAAWTVKVLTELDHEFPGLSQSIGLMSTVSGGSVGTMFYLGHRGLLDKAADDPASKAMLRHIADVEEEPEKARPPVNEDPKQPSNKDIMKPSAGTALEAVAWGLAAPDFVRTVIPVAAPPLIDRGWALESLWWNQMGRGPKDRNLMEAVTIRDLIALTREHRIPPVIFNATCVETGQRVLISPLHVAVAKADKDHPQAWDWHPEHELIEKAADAEPRPQELVDTPIDFLDFYDAALSDPKGKPKTSWGGTRSNLRVSTAVRLSATFSYVTPVARPSPTQGFGPWATVERIGLWGQDALKSMRNVSDTDQERRLKRLNRHFCDGGYADNPGLVTAVRSLKDLLRFYRQEGAPPRPFDRVLVIRIEPFPKTAAQHAKDNTGYQSALFGPSAAVNAMRVSTQAERGNLELELLEGSSYAKRLATLRHQQAIQQYRQAVDALQTFQKQLKEQQPLANSLRGIIDQAQLPTGLGNSEISDGWIQLLLPQANSLDGMIGDLTKLTIPEGLQEQWKELQEQWTSARKLLNTAEEAATGVPAVPDDPDMIPIDSVTFRFEVYLEDRISPPSNLAPIKPDERIEPPLTWTLTEMQKKDIHRAWLRMKLKKNWSDYFDSTADTISAEAIGIKFFAPVKAAK